MGAFGVMTGLSLGILAVGTRAAAACSAWANALPSRCSRLSASCWWLAAATVMAGWAIRRRSRRGRLAALALAIPNLVLVPFGTALGVYTFWVLLNNDARRAFGRPPREAARRDPRCGPRRERRDSKLWAALSCSVGLIGGAIVLASKSDSYVRFHAWQSVLAFSLPSRRSRCCCPLFQWWAWGITGVIFWLSLVALYVFLIVKALQGERYKLPLLGDLAANLSS